MRLQLSLLAVGVLLLTVGLTLLSWPLALIWLGVVLCVAALVIDFDRLT